MAEWRTETETVTETVTRTESWLGVQAEQPAALIFAKVKAVGRSIEKLVRCYNYVWLFRPSRPHLTSL